MPMFLSNKNEMSIVFWENQLSQSVYSVSEPLVMGCQFCSDLLSFGSSVSSQGYSITATVPGASPPLPPPPRQVTSRTRDWLACDVIMRVCLIHLRVLWCVFTLRFSRKISLHLHYVFVFSVIRKLNEYCNTSYNSCWFLQNSRPLGLKTKLREVHYYQILYNLDPPYS